MTIINKPFLAALALTALSLPAFAADTAQPAAQTGTSATEVRPLDRIVAVVNNDVITEFELQTRVHQAALNLRRQNIELPAMPELRRQVLDRLITEKAVSQRAKEIGIRVEEPMVTASIEQIAHNNKLTLEQLRDRLAADNVNYPDFRKQIREEITQQRLREREVDSKIRIPESEIDAYMAEQAGFASGMTTEYKVQHILLPIPSGATESEIEDIKDKAEDLAKRARRGEDFGQLVAANSKAEDALSGGDLGWRDASRLPSLFWQAIDGHTTKNFVAVTHSASAYHVIKLIDERDGVQAKLANTKSQQSHVRHILLFVSDIMPEDRVLSRLNTIRQSLAEGKGDFATYARLNSVDSSATRGGDLGWISAGDTAPEFEAAVNKLKPGEVSEPVRTQFGYHLIELMERRHTNADATRSRLAARQALRAKKLEEATYTWQRELHDRAYIEIRQDAL